MRFRTAKICFFVLAAALIILNGLTLLSALPYTTGTQIFCDSHGCITVARDFSAYFEAGYRFIHNPTQVYYEGNLSNDYPILPNPQDFRYSPFFIPLFIVPLVISFDYQSAFRVFDLLQFMLLPLIAYLLFKIMRQVSVKDGYVKKKVFAFFSLTLLFALLQPLVPSASNLTFWSWSYWHLWEQGEARVLQTMFLVLTFYLILRDSRLSGVAFVLSSFDPRMSIISLPLIFFLCLKRRNLRKFVLSSLISFALIYTPTLLYANLAGQFYNTISIKDFAVYSYEWIPILTVVSLTGTMILLDLVTRFENRKVRNSSVPWAIKSEGKASPTDTLCCAPSKVKFESRRGKDAPTPLWRNMCYQQHTCAYLLPPNLFFPIVAFFQDERVEAPTDTPLSIGS